MQISFGAWGTPVEAEFTEGSPTRCFYGGKWIDFPIRFKWHAGLWFELFNKHVDLIVEDINRAKAEDVLVVYLSCPISTRGGSYSFTNVEISRHIAKRLEMKWGSRFWVLNPTLYQMESGQGTGLIRRHANLLSLEKGHEVDINKLSVELPIIGGDYLRAWSRVLVEDGDKNLGSRFDAFYFVGPSDVRDFFSANSGCGQGLVRDLTQGVEDYFARKYATNAEFRAYFSEATAEDRKKEFFKFYTLKAGAHFSKGSHDEFNIWDILNKLRVKEMGTGSEMPGYFDGHQIGLGSAETGLTSGYATSSPLGKPNP